MEIVVRAAVIYLFLWLITKALGLNDDFNNKLITDGGLPGGPLHSGISWDHPLGVEPLTGRDRPVVPWSGLRAAGPGLLRSQSWARCNARGPFRFAVAQVILERSNQHRSKIGAFVHRPNLRGPPQLPGELDGRFHRVAVRPFCRQYGEQCKRSYGTTARHENA